MDTKRDDDDPMPASAAPPKTGAHDDAIEAWFAEHFNGHPAMRDTEARNHVRRAVDDLKQRLA